MSKKFLVLSLSIVMGLFLALGSSFLPTLGGVNAQTRVPTVTPRQPQNTQPQNTQPQNRQPQNIQPQANRQANLIDIAFLNEASQAGLGYIQLSQLALRKSNNAQIRQFAQAEIQEQQQNAADFRRISSQLRVSLPTTIPARYQAALSRLSQLSGTQFDNAFLDEGGINSHLEAASVFQREAAFGQNPDLLAVANRGLNIINQHFTTASQLTNYRFAQVPRRYGEQTALETPNINP